MGEPQVNTKRIAKNALMLYLRMFLGLSVSLYTARVVLDALGAENYGINAVVGGIVGMFSFINSSMAGASSRFIAFDIGRNKNSAIQKTFSNSLTLHIVISLIFLILAETIGLWFVSYKLNVAGDRMWAAHILYQLSVISTSITITGVPYTASIMAKERMGIYAYIELLNIFARLGIVFLITYVQYFDTLVFYAALQFLVAIGIFAIYRAYCKNQFTFCKYKFSWRWDEIKPMLSFSGWDLYGNMSTVARTQGVTVLLNLFYGTILNAAAGIAAAVQGAVMAFAGNILTAFRPQIVKSYAAGNCSDSIDLVYTASKISCIILLLITVPLCLQMPFILSLWLVEVPAYTVILCQLTLIFNFFANLSSLLITLLHATGNIKRPSIINGTLYLSVVPFSYLSFSYNAEPYMPYIINIAMVLLGMLSNGYSVQLYIKEFTLSDYLKKFLLPTLITAILCIGTAYYCTAQTSNGWFNFMLTCTVSSLSIIISFYFFVLTRNERHTIHQFIKSKLYA